jgi:beta-lactamase regulating signal transducer with metallopeptidase domain
MLPIILEAAIRSAVLIAVIWLGLRLLRMRNPHVLMAVWQMTLAASLLMPFLVSWPAITLPAATLPLPHLLPFEPADILSAPSGLSPDLRSPVLDWRTAGSIIYGVVAAALLLRLLGGIVLTWMLCRSATRIREDWTAGRDVRASARVNVPVTFLSTILLPVNHPSWDAVERRAVIAHESSHISQGDFYVLLLASINRAVFWFSPFAWWLQRQMAYLAEARSDTAAMTVIGDRVRYAEILLAFGAKAGRTTAGLAMAGSETLSRRVERILTEVVMPKGMDWKRWSAVIACVVLLTAGAIAQAPSQAQDSQVATTSDPATREQRRAEQQRRREEAQIDPQILDNYVGHYQLSEFSIFTVARTGDNLFAQLTGQPPFQVYPESTKKFFYKVVSAQLSFITDPQGRATALVLHQNGLERPAQRISQSQAQNAEASLAKKIKDSTPTPGSEAALRRQIEAFQQKQPRYGEMTDELAAVTRPQIPAIDRQFAALGSLQSISFRGVGLQGWDVYEAKFENGISICRIFLAADGKVSGLLFQWGP